MNLGEGQSVVSAIGRDLAEFVGFRPKKFTAGRNVKEQVFNGDLRSARKDLFLLREQLSCDELDCRSDRVFRLSLQPHPGHKRDKQQSFTSKAKSLYGK